MVKSITYTSKIFVSPQIMLNLGSMKFNINNTYNFFLHNIIDILK